MATRAYSARANRPTTMFSLTKMNSRALSFSILLLSTDTDKYFVHLPCFCIQLDYYDVACNGAYWADDIQSLSYALCHVYARCTRSISIPAPVFCKFSILLQAPPTLKKNPDAHNVCRRAKNHYDPEEVQRLFSPDTASTEDDDRAAQRGGRGGRGGGGNRNTPPRDHGNDFRECLQQAHERMQMKMYFC
jgi:hypothetical protein